MDPGLAVVLDRHLAVDEDEPVALRALDAPPLAAGKIVRDFRRQAGELLEVVDDDVRRRTFDERPAVAEAGAVGGEGGQAPVGVLERAHRLLADDAAQELGRVAAAGGELRVRAAVRHGGADPLVVVDLVGPSAGDGGGLGQGSASFCLRSATVPTVASTQAGSSLKRFQSSNVKVKAAVVVTPWPYTRMPRCRQESSQPMRPRCASGNRTNDWPTWYRIGRPLTSASCSMCVKAGGP